ncbi:MAG: DUF1611 domain-containing protein [Candidatus Eremiobacteraeota bacterium]|nr:DUF1611 domain-containing protein [Candidatus Eremiobacteraeota bacterium]
MKRRYAILAPDEFIDNAKTAHGVIAYGADETVAVIDASCAGKTVRDVLPHLRSDAPIVATVAEALRYQPSSLLIGTAPQGGSLPPSWRSEIRRALAEGLEIVSGLHDMLADDAEFAELARAAGTTIWDVRRPPAVPLFSGAAYSVQSPILLMVGNDCAVGKMTAALELARAAEKHAMRAAFVPTGQTGIMIAGWGIAIDRVICDFASGAAEALVRYAAEGTPDIIFVEGQGALNHPAYAQVTLALMYGCAPDALVLVCDPVRKTVSGLTTPTLGYRDCIRLHEAVLAAVKPARVIGIALNTRGLSDEAARAEIDRAQTETTLPVDDVVRFGADAFYAAIAPAIVKSQPLRMASK